MRVDDKGEGCGIIASMVLIGAIVSVVAACATVAPPPITAAIRPSTPPVVVAQKAMPNCLVIKGYVAIYGEAPMISWAQSNGYTPAQIQAIRVTCRTI